MWFHSFYNEKDIFLKGGILSQGYRDKAAFLKCWGPNRYFVSFLHSGEPAQLPHICPGSHMASQLGDKVFIQDEQGFPCGCVLPPPPTTPAPPASCLVQGLHPSQCSGELGLVSTGSADRNTLVASICLHNWREMGKRFWKLFPLPVYTFKSFIYIKPCNSSSFGLCITPQ